MSSPDPRALARALACALLLAAPTIGCRQQMEDGARLKPLEAFPSASDEPSARHPVPGTVARGRLRTDEHLYAGTVDGKLARAFPFPIARADLERGRERYAIFCAPCHDLLGTGQGMIVQRGLRPSASFHVDRLREAPVGHLYDVITRGFGAMSDYSAQIPPEDRWRIVAYLRALQLSRDVRVDELPADERARVR